MINSNCRYCGDVIIIPQGIKSDRVINKLVEAHESTCALNDTIVSPTAVRNLRSQSGKSIICKTSELNPGLHFENAKVSIENIHMICTDLEDLQSLAIAQKTLDTLAELERELAKKYKWS